MVDESFWEPLPPLEDLISGNFKRSQKRIETRKETENFEYEFFNKIKDETEEEGEISDPEEGEIDEQIKPAKKIKTEPTPKKEVKKSASGDTKKSNSNKKQLQQQQQQQQQPFVPRIVCRYFMDGVCSKGDKCTFSHAVVPNRTTEEARVKDACKFFIAGSCMKGNACHFSHELSKFPCKFFHLKGECSAALKGCRFSHDPVSAEELERLRGAEQERISEKERAIQTLNSFKSTNSSAASSSSSFDSSTTETRNQPEKTAAKQEQMESHQALVNPFADVEDLYE
jgi:hypothetical protein